ncbi:Lysine--tRNA ligase [compost metagenome]
MNDKTTETTALSSDATEVRRQKLALLREQIGDVYPAHFHRTLTNAELAEKYADIEPDTETGDTVTVAGRVYSSRNSGMFMDIHDASGKVQIFSHKDTTPETARNLLPMIDIGDIIGVTGKVRRTKRGELTINAEEITMLTKSLLPKNGTVSPILSCVTASAISIFWRTRTPSCASCSAPRSCPAFAASWRPKASSKWKRRCCRQFMAVRRPIRSRPSTIR